MPRPHVGQAAELLNRRAASTPLLPPSKFPIAIHVPLCTVGALTFVDNAVKDATGTVNLRATIANGDRRFWPGRFVNVRLVLRVLRGAILIPATAPQMSAKGQFVYVVKEDSTAEMRPVTVGQKQGEMVVVEKGIAPGDKVVVNGQLGFTPGGKVLVEQPKGAALSKNGGSL